MKVKMLRTSHGHETHEDGSVGPAQDFYVGRVYDVGELLGKAFLAMRIAQLVEETKAIMGAPENKSCGIVSAVSDVSTEDLESTVSMVSNDKPAPKKRGRPRKVIE